MSVAYLGAFILTFGLLMPFQRNFLPEYANYASILFLPHGVRVLTAWLYGSRALLLLAPSALFTHGILYGTMGFSSDYFFAALFGISCATSSFWLFSKLGMDFRQDHTQLASWREILLVGSFASIINVVGTSYFFGFGIETASAYFIGDFGGLLACMLILMWAFRWMRRAC